MSANSSSTIPGAFGRSRRLPPLGLLLLAVASWVAPAAAGAVVDEPQPARDFSFVDINPRSKSHGRKLTLRDLYASRGAVLQFTASWCEYCRGEMPGLQELYAKGRAPIVFVGADEYGAGPASLLIVAERSKLTAPLLFVPAEEAAELERHYSYEVLPATYLIDRDGLIRKVHEGELGRDRLVREVERELGLRIPAPD